MIFNFGVQVNQFKWGGGGGEKITISICFLQKKIDAKITRRK